MKNLFLAVAAGGLAIAIAAAFIFKGDQILGAVGVDPANPLASLFGTPEPAEADAKAATVRALVYTRDLEAGHAIESGVDVTIDRFSEDDVGEEPIVSDTAEADPEAFSRANGRILNQSVQAGMIVQVPQLRRPEPKVDATSDPGYRAAIAYIDRLRALVDDPGNVFVPRRLVLSDDVTEQMTFEETAREFGGRYLEGRFIGGRVDVSENRTGGVSERIARNVPIKRVGFQDTRCGESRYYLEVPRDAGDRIALARLSGAIDRIRLTAVDAPEDLETNRVCSAGTCQEASVPEPADADVEGEGEDEGEQAGDGSEDGQEGEGEGSTDGPSDDQDNDPARDAGDEGETRSQAAPTQDPFALGREQASANVTPAQQIYCRDGQLIDPRKLEEDGR